MKKHMSILVALLVLAVNSAVACDNAMNQNTLTLNGYTIQSVASNPNGTTDTIYTNGVDTYRCSQQYSSECHKNNGSTKATQSPMGDLKSLAGAMAGVTGMLGETTSALGGGSAALGGGGSKAPGGPTYSIQQLGSQGYQIVKEYKLSNGQTEPVLRKGNRSYRCTARSEFKTCNQVATP